jgi:hypothetical protein
VISFIASLLGAGVRLWLELLAMFFGGTDFAPLREDPVGSFGFSGVDATDGRDPVVFGWKKPTIDLWLLEELELDVFFNLGGFDVEEGLGLEKLPIITRPTIIYKALTGSIHKASVARR